MNIFNVKLSDLTVGTSLAYQALAGAVAILPVAAFFVSATVAERWRDLCKAEKQAEETDEPAPGTTEY